jgi:hypothetical protein
MSAEKAEKAEVELCPRCGQPYSTVERRTMGYRTYYYAVHYLGREAGKVRTKKCYLGPQRYEYVERLHAMELAGAIDKQRFKRYLHEVLDSIEPSLEELLDVMCELAKRALEEAEGLEPEKVGKALDKVAVVRDLLFKVQGKLYEKQLAAKPLKR